MDSLSGWVRRRALLVSDYLEFSAINGKELKTWQSNKGPHPHEVNCLVCMQIGSYDDKFLSVYGMPRAIRGTGLLP